MGLKNKRLEDDLKGKGGRLSKRVKLMENSQKELQGVQKFGRRAAEANQLLEKANLKAQRQNGQGKANMGR